MRKEPKPEEKFAFGLVGAALGVDVDDTGEQRVPRHVDAILKYASGDSAAMEVTVLGDRREFELWRLLQKDDYLWRVEGSQFWWNVSVGRMIKLKQFREFLPDVIRLHEQYGVIRPDVYFPSAVVAASPALQWFKSQDIEVWGHDEVTAEPGRRRRHPGAVTVMPSGKAGAVGDANVVPEWLSAEAAKDSQVKRKIDKLQASGYKEQHLFLVVDISVPSFSFGWVVGDEEEVPIKEPQVGSVTHLWLVSTIGQTYLTWTAQSGWARAPLPSREHADSKED